MSRDELIKLGQDLEEQCQRRNARRRERQRWLKTAPREETALRYRAEEKPCSIAVFLQAERLFLRWLPEFPHFQGNATAASLRQLAWASFRPPSRTQPPTTVGRGSYSEASPHLIGPIRTGVPQARAERTQSPSAAAGLRRQFSAARPPGLGGGHCALGLVDAVADEPCGGGPVQGYKGQSPGEPTVLVTSQRFRSRAFVGVEQSSRIEPCAALCDVIQAARDVVQPLPDPREIQIEGGP